MKRNTHTRKLLVGLCLGTLTAAALAQPTTQDKDGLPHLSLKEFIQRASQNDTRFESILIDQMPLPYRHDALLPSGDVILSVKQQYNFYLSQDRRAPDTTLSLSKLFPYSGTDVSLSYNRAASALSTTEESSLQVLISQPIAQNAFGKGTRLRAEIIDVENDVSRHQVVEAYEDYLASLTVAYYNWYSAYENLKVGQASLHSTQKLLDNILERQRQKIALPIDVNKMELSLIGKRENLISLQEIYDSLSNLIFKAIRHTGAGKYVPTQPDSPARDVDFTRDYAAFVDDSRTYRTLRLLEQQGTLEVKKAADDLLPSTNLLLGYTLEGEDWGIKDEERSYFAGISLRWPIGRSVDKAKYQIAEVQRKKTVLSNQDKYAELHTNLQNLFQQIRREQDLIALSEKKTRLAEAILRDEAENYSFGKVSLNDYIFAVNRVDEVRFSHTERTVQLNKLLIEWLRLTDRLVGEEVLDTVGAPQ